MGDKKNAWLEWLLSGRKGTRPGTPGPRATPPPFLRVPEGQEMALPGGRGVAPIGPKGMAVGGSGGALAPMGERALGSGWKATMVPPEVAKRSLWRTMVPRAAAVGLGGALGAGLGKLLSPYTGLLESEVTASPEEDMEKVVAGTDPVPSPSPSPVSDRMQPSPKAAQAAELLQAMEAEEAPEEPSAPVIPAKGNRSAVDALRKQEASKSKVKDLEWLRSQAQPKKDPMEDRINDRLRLREELKRERR